MSDILIAYYSQSGNTEQLAKFIAEGAIEEGGTIDLQEIELVRPKDLLEYKAIIIGSPAYYGMPAAKIVEFFDESVAVHGSLAGKIGGAFATAGNLGGGCETTCTAIVKMLLVHGMLTIGSTKGGHYGAVSLGAPKEEDINHAKNFGKNITKAVARMG